MFSLIFLEMCLSEALLMNTHSIHFHVQRNKKNHINTFFVEEKKHFRAVGPGKVVFQK